MSIEELLNYIKNKSTTSSFYFLNISHYILGNNYNLNIPSIVSGSIDPSESRLLNTLAWSAIIMLFSGFLFARLFMNIGFLFAGIYILTQREKLTSVLKNKWIWTFFGVALISILDDIIRTGMGFLSENGMFKLILVLLPAFVLVWSPDRAKIQKVNHMYIVAIFLGSTTSLMHFFLEAGEVVFEYSRAKVMSVPAYGDHIRFSWAVVISCLLSLYNISMFARSKWHYFHYLNIIFQILFLHILGAKTGLLILYLTLPLVIYYSLSSGKKLFSLLTFPLIAILIWAAYSIIPSFKNRVDFMRYDFSYYVEGDYRPGLSDGLRVYSIKAGLECIKEAPIFGVGFSNLGEKVGEWYQRNIPEVPSTDYFLPSSQLIIYWASAGIFGLLLFLWHIIYPFTVKELRNNRWFLIFYIPAISTFLFETHLEGQISIFIYAFFTAWFYLLDRDSEKDLRLDL
jgi:O-antigen ligase